MFTIIELYFVFISIILLYIAFAVTKEDNKNNKVTIGITNRISLIILFLFVIITTGVIWFFITKPNEYRIKIGSGKTYVKKFYTGFTNNLKIYVRPINGNCNVNLLYGNEKNDDKISQCNWISKSTDSQTNTFINDVLGTYYELRITPTQTTDVLIGITKANNINVYQTPHNAIIAPINASHSRIVEIVPEGSTYSENQKSATYDFGTSNATNIEIFASCSNSTAPKMSLFGSDVNESDKFVRITELTFIDGTFTSLNSKYYIDNVALTHHRYFYIQITEASATNLYVKIVRRNY